VANLLVPGDYVNILVTGGGASTATDTGGGGEEGQAGGEQVFDQPARFLYQKVLILAVGQTRKLEPGETAATNADGTPTSDTSSGLITFVVPADAAQKIASIDGGSIYLTLVAKDYQPEAIGPLDVNAPLPGETQDQLTPYGPEGRPES
jgi:hypothetical protein